MGAAAQRCSVALYHIQKSTNSTELSQADGRWPGDGFHGTRVTKTNPGELGSWVGPAVCARIMLRRSKNMGTVSFQLPADVEQQLRRELGDLNAVAKEAALVELYRHGQLSHGKLAESLGLSRYETDAVLKR